MSDARRCPKCSAEPPADARYCHRCATPLDGGGDEQLLWTARYAFRAMAGWSALVVLLWIGLAYAWLAHVERRTPFARYFFLAVALLPALGVLIVYLQRRFRTRYRLTTRRLLVHGGVLGRAVTEIDLSKLTDVSVRQALVHRFVDVGDLTAYASDATSRAEIVGVASPHRVKEMVRGAADRARSG